MPFTQQQKARQRKVVYLILILALFTGSLLHRRLVVEPQAEALQLREVSRGEVELTSAAVRLSLTGSRGIAVTFLWAAAIDRMAKHEWNELELLVGSITKLQPYFITPWLFQSWNLAFNVAVECDRPRDKYYYVSRGLELLAEGERRNQGTVDDTIVVDASKPKFPGHPELRHHMGFTYQLKLGNSDEKNTMRSLLEMSCIDPLKRDPDKLMTVNERGQGIIKEDEFVRICQDYPRLIRRLREQLGYNTPKQVVEFLAQNRDVPSRFKKTATSADQRESELETPRRQFPILPPTKAKKNWPDSENYQLTQEAIDVFLIARTWYEYAQEPLPPPNPDPGVTDKELDYARKYDRLRYRLPKAMAVQIFRGYPARAQMYIAEALEAEGWFDDDGWVIRDWFDHGAEGEGLRVGTEPKYHAGSAYQAAYDAYKQYGVASGLYLTQREIDALNLKAQLARTALKLPANEHGSLRPDQRAQYGASYEAHQKLFWNGSYRHMTNFDANFYTADGERYPETVQARKLLFEAEMLRKTNDFQALTVYEQAWPLWMHVLLQHPRFASIQTVQEEIYEPELQYLRRSQEARKDVYRTLVLGLAQMTAWPHPDWEKWQWITPSEKAKIMPLRKMRGPLDSVLVYYGPGVDELKEAWFGLTFGAMLAGRAGFAPPAPFPGQQNYALAGYAAHGETRPAGWNYLITENSTSVVRDRMGMVPLTPRMEPSGMP